MKFKYAPLPGSFMILSMLGLIISLVYMNYGRLDPSFGVAFIIVFAIMLISSILSMTHGPVEESFAMDNARKRKK